MKIDTVQKTKELVDSTVKLMRDNLLKETEDMDPKLRWLVVGRVLQSLWQSHFQISYRAAEKSIDKVSESSTSKPRED